MQEEFHMYSKLGCSHCKSLKQVFTLKNIPFKEYRYPEHFKDKFFKDLFGKDATFPQVVHNGIKIGGASDTIKYMKENNIIS